MSQPDPTPKVDRPASSPRPGGGMLRRRRRANAEGGREASHRVRVTAAESEQLTALADAQGITVARLLVESALAGDREIASQRRDAIIELFAVRRLLAAVSNNVNQVARHANAGEEFPAEAAAVLGAVRRLVPQLSAAAEALAMPEVPRRPARRPVTQGEDWARVDDDPGRPGGGVVGGGGR